MIIAEPPAITAALGEAFDIAIFGAGAAGIVLANELSSHGQRVALFEGGLRDLDPKSQDCYQGRSVGWHYAPLDICRLRYFGGTTNHWSGVCYPLDDDDFAPRAWVPLSGWPIGRSDLQPYLNKAAGIVEIRPFRPAQTVPDSGGSLLHLDYQFSPAVRFAVKYGEQIAASANISLLLGTNLVDLRYGENGSVAAASVALLDAPETTIPVRAKRYVLAMGGIENARLLLWAGRNAPNRPGAQHIGRYFMEHIHADVGEFASWNLFWAHQRLLYSFSPQQNRQLGLNHTTANLPARDVGGYKSGLVDALEQRALDAIHFFKQLDKPILRWSNFQVVAEQAPNPASAITLGTERDRFGLPLSQLDWQLTDNDLRSVRMAGINYAQAFARADIGRVRLKPWVLGAEPIDKAKLHGGNHHMGTTRMAASADCGLVDRDCRVFGTENLYVAGSSVFPNAGHANPTFTIVQLALRLADRLRQAA